MNQSHTKTRIVAIATIVGTAVGAGMFGIPYVFSQAGSIIGTTYIVVLGAVVSLTMVAFASVVRSQSTVHQLPGYARSHLGIGWRFVTIISVVFGMYAGLIAYTIEIGNFLYSLFGAFGGSALLFGIVFWALACTTVYVGLSAVMRMESLLVAVLIAAVLLIVGLSLPYMDVSHLVVAHFSNSGTPYGVILFAFGALAAVPEVYRYLKKHRSVSFINRSIAISLVIVGLLFLIFAYTVVGVTGEETTQTALIGLGEIVGEHVLTIGALLGVLTMGSSFLMTAMAMSAMYQHDFAMKRSVAFGLTVLPPLLFLLYPIGSFIQIIGTAGAVTGGFQGVIVWLLYMKVAHGTQYGIRVPRLLIWLFHGIFIAGIGYQVWSVLTA